MDGRHEFQEWNGVTKIFSFFLFLMKKEGKKDGGKEGRGEGRKEGRKEGKQKHLIVR